MLGLYEKILFQNEYYITLDQNYVRNFRIPKIPKMYFSELPNSENSELRNFSEN